MSRLAKVVICLSIVVGFIFGAMKAHDACVWHQIEKQALAADVVEGNQE